MPNDRLRHPLLADPTRSAVFVVDAQERFRPHVDGFAQMVAAIRLLGEGANLLQVPVGWSEQYRKGLGATVQELLDVLPGGEEAGDWFEKLEISSCAAPGWQQLPAAVRDAEQLIVVGIETHVCVRQTVCDLLVAGRQVQIPVDAVASRSALHRDTSLRTLERAGAQLVTVEQVLFDWLGVAGTPEFREVQALIKAHDAAAR